MSRLGWKALTNSSRKWAFGEKFQKSLRTAIHMWNAWTPADILDPTIPLDVSQVVACFHRKSRVRGMMVGPGTQKKKGHPTERYKLRSLQPPGLLWVEMCTSLTTDKNEGHPYSFVLNNSVEIRVQIPIHIQHDCYLKDDPLITLQWSHNLQQFGYILYLFQINKNMRRLQSSSQP